MSFSFFRQGFFLLRFQLRDLSFSKFRVRGALIKYKGRSWGRVSGVCSSLFPFVILWFFFSHCIIKLRQTLAVFLKKIQKLPETKKRTKKIRKLHSHRLTRGPGPYAVSAVKVSSSQAVAGHDWRMYRLSQRRSWTKWARRSKRFLWSIKISSGLILGAHYYVGCV